MAAVVQLNPKRTAPSESPLTPELKEFIDRVIVPILVKQYLAEMSGALEVAEDAGSMAKSPAKGFLRGRVGRD